MSMEDRIAQAKRQQEKGQFIEETGVPVGEEKPTEYAKSAKLVVGKLFEPHSEEDKQLMSSIPKQILPNTMMLVGIENDIRQLYTGDVELYNPKTQKVTLYLNADNQVDENGNVTNGLIKFRTVTARGYSQGHFWANHWHGFTGGLFLQLPAVEGKSREQGVAVVSAITNSDRALLEAQSNNQAGILKRLWRGTVGRL